MYFDDSDDVTNPPWNPTPAQLEAFRKRDRELAATNVSELDAQGHYPRAVDTLHSRESFFQGFQAVLEERSKWARKWRVVELVPSLVVVSPMFVAMVH